MRQTVIMRSLLWASIAAAGVAAAATPPPAPPFEDISWAAHVASKPTMGVMLGAASVTLEETPLTDVVRVAGGAIAAPGGAGEHAYSLCYTIVEDQTTVRLWLISDAQGGGPDHKVTEITAQIVDHGATPDCPALRLSLRPVSFSNGLWIGTGEALAESKFSVSPAIREPWRAYVYLGKLPGEGDPDGFDVLNWLTWKSNGGSLDSIVAGQVTIAKGRE